MCLLLCDWHLECAYYLDFFGSVLIRLDKSVGRFAADGFGCIAPE